MKQTLKRSLALLLAAILCLGLLPVSALAADEEAESLSDQPVIEEQESDGEQQDEVVAEVLESGVRYATLEDAFSAAENGGTVKLLADVALSGAITVKKDVTLDLNGKNVTRGNSGTAMFDVSRGTLTITGDGTVEYTNYQPGTHIVRVRAGTSVILESGTLKAAQTVVYMDNGSKLVIDGGVYDGLIFYNGGEIQINGGLLCDDAYQVMHEHGALPAGKRFVAADVAGFWTLGDKLDGAVEVTANKNLVYTGAPQALVTGEAADGLTLLYSLDGETFGTDVPEATDAGDYTVYYKVDGGESYNDVADSVAVSIAKRSRINVGVSGNVDTVTYDGSEHAVTGFTVESPVADSTLKVTLVEGKEAQVSGIDAGTYWMGLEPSDFIATSDNYDQVYLIMSDGLLTIEPAESADVVISGRNSSVVYDGQPHEVVGYDVNYLEDDSIQVELIGEARAAGANAGTYEMGLTAEDFRVTSDNYENINVTVYDGSLIIGKAPTLDVTITGASADGVYDGQEKTAEGFTTDITDETTTAVLAEGAEAKVAETNAGTYAMGLTADDFVVTSGNYENVRVTVVDGSLTIAPAASVDVTITGRSASGVYDGAEKRVIGFDTNITDETISVALAEDAAAEAVGTAAGVYPMGLTSGSFVVTSDNYAEINVTVRDGALTIAAQSLEGASIAEIAAQEFSGEAVEPQVTVTLSDGTVLAEDTDYTVAYAGNDAVGEATVTVTGIGNYAGTLTATFAIEEPTPVTPPAPVTPVTPYTPPVNINDEDVPLSDTPVEIGDEDVPLVDAPMLFADVEKNDWYYDAVAYVYNRSVMTGESDTIFNPQGATDRATIATVLYRLETDPAAAENIFDDVENGKWYTEAIAWAAANDVVKGYGNGLYGPSDEVTREQLVTILYRYAQLKGYDVSASAELDEFADAEDVHDWSLEAMKWAVGAGLIEGSHGKLTPSGNASRAQVAAILMRFLENIAK